MNCSLCKNGEMKADFDVYFTKLNDGYLIVENVPCLKCDQCGEIVFSLSVIAKIEKIIAAYKNTSSKVSIIDYNKAA